MGSGSNPNEKLSTENSSVPTTEFKTFLPNGTLPPSNKATSKACQNRSQLTGFSSTDPSVEAILSSPTTPSTFFAKSNSRRGSVVELNGQSYLAINNKSLEDRVNNPHCSNAHLNEPAVRRGGVGTLPRRG